MNIAFLHTHHSIRPWAPVELLVVADHRTIRAEIDWWTLERVIDTSPLNEEAVRDFLHRNRDALEVLISAQLYARGIPLGHHLRLTVEELRRLPSP